MKRPLRLPAPQVLQRSKSVPLLDIAATFGRKHLAAPGFLLCRLGAPPAARQDGRPPKEEEHGRRPWLLLANKTRGHGQHRGSR